MEVGCILQFDMLKVMNHDWFTVDDVNIAHDMR
jgi:hypothetical protein